MKVFVVLEGYSYEGYDRPHGVYSTRQKAEAAAQKRKDKRYSADTVEVVEYETDKDDGAP